MNAKKTTAAESAEKTKEQTTSAKRQPKCRPMSRGALIALILVTSIVVGGVLVTSTIQQRYEQAEEALNNLHNKYTQQQLQLNALQARIERQEIQVSEDDGYSNTPHTANTATDTLGFTKVDTARQSAEEGQAEQVINEQLEQRLSYIETMLEEHVIYRAKQHHLFAALLALQQKIHQAEAFADELKVAQDVSRHNAELAIQLAALEPYANTGVMTYEELQLAFTEMINDILASNKHNENATLWQKVQANLANVVTIRRIGEREGNTAEAIIARTEILLDERNLGQAIKELSLLEGAGLKKVSPWIKDAQATLATEQIIEAINLYTLDTLSESEESVESENEEKAETEYEEEEVSLDKEQEIILTQPAIDTELE